MTGIWGSRVQSLLAAAVVVGAIALAAPSLAAATIVYRHGGDIWTMNDNGTGAHALVTTAQIPGAGPWTIGAPDVLPGGAVVVFTGTTNAFNDGPGHGPPGGCGLNCSGTYKLQGGKLTRLTAAAAPCGAAPSATSHNRATRSGWVARPRVAR